MTVQLDLTFPRRYEVELLEELSSSPPGVRQIYFPGPKEQGGRNGLLVKVIPHGSTPWVGVFAFGYPSPKSLTGVFSCPDKQLMCIVSAGAGYLVRADAPDSCDEIRSYPIVEVHPILDRELLVFVDFSTLMAYGPKGMVWLADGRSWDGIEIIETTSDWIRGRAWNPPHQGYIEFLVDVGTGVLRKDSLAAK